ncbi:hypothetical protein Bhyg_07504 [Pseudolycoriella hygida]|uniref:Uncharacterized protein n=1 Tax=Pseudolycoriella hygida TaxID=35572 RepID=A0A9Q0S223_9DIPT|nr:hypothetical protein Bhyg_07504 [Pseudolycoriella hygida]
MPHINNMNFVKIYDEKHNEKYMFIKNSFALVLLFSQCFLTYFDFKKLVNSKKLKFQRKQISFHFEPKTDKCDIILQVILAKKNIVDVCKEVEKLIRFLNIDDRYFYDKVRILCFRALTTKNVFRIFLIIFIRDTFLRNRNEFPFSIETSLHLSRKNNKNSSNVWSECDLIALIFQLKYNKTENIELYFNCIQSHIKNFKPVLRNLFTIFFSFFTLTIYRELYNTKEKLLYGLFHIKFLASQTKFLKMTSLKKRTNPLAPSKKCFVPECPNEKTKNREKYFFWSPNLSRTEKKNNKSELALPNASTK